jgi:hypothetical protein
MKKPYIYLLTTKAITKKYDMFYVYLCDESVYEFKLSEYRVCKDEDFVEVSKLDNTVMESFTINNILRIRFISSKAKEIVDVEVVTLKPVA